MSHDIAIRENIHQICTRRDKALDEFTANLDVFLTAQSACKQALNVYGGFYGGSSRNLDNLTESIDRERALSEARKKIDASVWTHLMQTTGILELMNAAQKREWECQLSSEPPTADLNTVLATFETLWITREQTFLKGMADVFSNLDRRFKSHDAFKVKSRIILDGLFSSTSGDMSYRSRDQFHDIERICSILTEEPSDWLSLEQAIKDSRSGWGPQQSLTESRFFKIRGFMNGNAHVYFTDPAVVSKINEALRAYYGEVLPDGVMKEDSDITRSRSTAVSKDLAFYRTSPNTAKEVLECFRVAVDGPLLEPSAGDGALVHAMLDKFKDRPITAIEIDPGRFEILNRIEGINAIRGNFLSMTPKPIYAGVVMNPPFYGMHWIDHVLAAWEWLKPGGQLIAILPVTAEVGGQPKQVKFREWVDQYRRTRWGWDRAFNDLPAGSFAESGTNINTVTLTIKKPD